MNKIILLCAVLGFSGILSAQNANNAVTPVTNAQYRQIRSNSTRVLAVSAPGQVIGKVGGVNAGISANGNLLSLDGNDVGFRASENPEISSVCGTRAPLVRGGGNRDASCGYIVPCDDPSNRDAANTTTIDYFQLKWHVMLDGGSSSNIDQSRIDQMMAELNADFASASMIFCASPATFTEDAGNYTHDDNTEEFSLKNAYNVSPTQFINIYVVGTMGPGGYARFPYDPNGGMSATGGIVLNRGNCVVGTHTLAHEMGHVFGLEHICRC